MTARNGPPGRDDEGRSRGPANVNIKAATTPPNTTSTDQTADGSSVTDSPGYKAAYPIYRELGWPPPKGFTGHDGADPSGADMQAWADEEPDGNIAIRLPDDVIGIDADDYNGKTGAATVAEGEKRWCKLPYSPRSTARPDTKSGIRLYRIPPGEILPESISFPELGLGGVGIIQRHHRYAVSWPSIHPGTGTMYQWYGVDGPDEPPDYADIPDLPEAWLQGLRALNSPFPNGKADTDENAIYNVSAAITDGEMSQRVSFKLAEALAKLFGPQCRHDQIRDFVLGLLRLGKQGEPGVKAALKGLQEAFVNVVAKDRPGGREEAIDEFRKFIYKKINGTWVFSDKVAKLLAVESYDDTAWAHSVGADVVIEVDEEDVDEVYVDPDRCQLAEIEDGFWDARESLNIIYTVALSRMCSPWAVLAYVAARALTQIPSCIVLPPLIGGPGSLNWFAGIAAASGGGKGAAKAVARELLMNNYVEERNLGSGEGMVAWLGTARGSRRLGPRPASAGPVLGRRR